VIGNGGGNGGIMDGGDEDGKDCVLDIKEIKYI